MLLVGPLLRWRKDNLRRIKLVLIGLTLVATLVLEFALSAVSILPLLGLTFAVGLGIASFLPLRGRNIRRLPIAVWGMVIAHFGIAVALFGMASESAFSKENWSQ